MINLYVFTHQKTDSLSEDVVQSPETMIFRCEWLHPPFGAKRSNLSKSAFNLFINSTK